MPDSEIDVPVQRSRFYGVLKRESNDLRGCPEQFGRDRAAFRGNVVAMQAATLNCLMCGAPSRSDAAKCEHCGARLATVACPSCFGMIFQGSRFCPHCGTGVETTGPRKTELPCPSCKKKTLERKELGETAVNECPDCHGLWIGVECFERLCADREKQSAVLGMPGEAAAPGRANLDLKVRYVPCPVCEALMHRMNFAKCSGVIIDVCKGHGSWFDRDELRHIVEFIHAGGLDQAREKEKREAEAAMRRLETARREAAMDQAWQGGRYRRGYGGGFEVDEYDLISMAGSLLRGLLR